MGEIRRAIRDESGRHLLNPMTLLFALIPAAIFAVVIVLDRVPVLVPSLMAGATGVVAYLVSHHLARRVLEVVRSSGFSLLRDEIAEAAKTTPPKAEPSKEWRTTAKELDRQLMDISRSEDLAKRRPFGGGLARKHKRAGRAKAKPAPRKQPIKKVKLEERQPKESWSSVLGSSGFSLLREQRK